MYKKIISILIIAAFFLTNIGYADSGYNSLEFSSSGKLRVPLAFDKESSGKRVEGAIEKAGTSEEILVSKETLETVISESLNQYGAIHGADKRNHGLRLSIERLGIDKITILLNDSTLSEKQKSLIKKLLAFGKGSVFSFWGELDITQKQNLLNQLTMVDLDGIEGLYKTFIIDKKEGAEIEVTENNVTMPKVVDITDTNGPNYAKAEKAGEDAFKNGEICYLELAGGSGSRLGYEHAKIMFKASQIMNMSLARMRAKKIRALAEEYGKPVPWLIMTSDVTDKEVEEFFKNNIVDNKYFGEVPVQWVKFVRQRVMPQITDTGEFILNQAKDSIILGGFGHGDARDYVLRNQNILSWLVKGFGVKYVVMLNVDNAYMPGAPSVGYHIAATEKLASGTEKMSVHSVEKAGPGEKVGMNVLLNGRSAVIEYNQVPNELLYTTYIHVLDNDKIVFLKEGGKYRILKVVQLENEYRSVFKDPEWVKTNLVTVNDLPQDVSINYLGRQYIKDMLVRAKLWLLLGNTNGLIWSIDSFIDQGYSLPVLPVVVAKNKAVDGYHPETGEFFTKNDGRLKANKFECMAFQGFFHNPVMGAFILVPRPGYFAPIKEAKGSDTPARARELFAAYDASLLKDINWMVATDATVELTPAFAFLDGRYLAGRMGQSGVVGRGSKLHLSGSNVHVGSGFNMVEGKTFILRFNDEHNREASAQIGDNIEIQGDISITIDGSGSLIIDNDVRITGYQEYTVESDKILHITKDGPVWGTKKAVQILASNEGLDRFAQWDKWIGMSVSMDDLNNDMFRDYDYRSTGKALSPEMVFRFGLVWANMALEKARANGFTNRKVLIARDARKIEPELVEALASALRFAGLDVIYVASDGPNAVTSYSWAAQEHKPLMSIFLTASHVSRPKEVIVRGFKVAMLDESSSLQSLTTKEIMQTSKAGMKDLIVNPAKVNAMESMQKGKFIPSNIDANCVKMCALVSKTVASGSSLYNLAKELRASESPAIVLDNWDRRIGHVEPLKGMKVVVEGAHTPSGKLAADTFMQLGAEVFLINGDIQEIEGEHKADPSQDSNLTELKEAIAMHNADFGIAFDLDGDRGAIVVPERWKATAGTKFHSLAPDNLIVAMLPYMIKKGGYDPAVIGTEVGVIRDVLGTFAVNDMALRLGIKAFQTDAGYVFLKALRRELLPKGYVVPVYGERSGHCWLDVTGEFENPIAVAVLFATMVKESKYKDNVTQSKNPFLEAYEENIIPYRQSTRFQPLFHPKLLSELSSDLRNNTGWIYDAERPVNPPQAIIALGKDLGIQKLQQEFKIGNSYLTPAGNLRIKEFNTYQDVPDEGGLYRFADIVFEQDGKFAGRFVFRASSNDPTFVCSFETPLMDGETYMSASLRDRYLSIGGVVLDWLEHNGIAGVTGNIKYPNKDATEPVVTEYRNKLASVKGDIGRGSVFGLLNTFARLNIKAGDRVSVLSVQFERRKEERKVWSESSVRREFTDAENLGIIKRTGAKDERGREIFEVLVSLASDQLEALPADVKMMLDRGRIKEEEIFEIKRAIDNVKRLNLAGDMDSFGETSIGMDPWQTVEILTVASLLNVRDNASIIKAGHDNKSSSNNSMGQESETVLLANSMGAERAKAIAALQDGDELLKIAREHRNYISDRKERIETIFRCYKNAIVAYQKVLNIVKGKDGLGDMEIQAEAGIERVIKEVKNKIIVFSAVNILYKVDGENRKKWFREWIARQPDNVVVVIISADVKEYEEVKDLQDVAYLQLVADPADAANSGITKAGIRDYHVLKLNTEERNAFFSNLDVYKEGINLGAQHLLNKKLLREITSGI